MTETEISTSEVQEPSQLVTRQGLVVDAPSRDQAHGIFMFISEQCAGHFMQTYALLRQTCFVATPFAVP